MSIDVERYFRTHIAKPVSASSFVTRSGSNGPTSHHSSHTIQGDTDMPDAGGRDLAPVKTSRSYQVNDPGYAGGRRTVEHDELARGYEYGRTAVHVSESDANVTEFPTFKKFEIVGFIPNDKVRAMRLVE